MKRRVTTPSDAAGGREARALAAVGHHPAVVGLLAVVVEARTLYFVFEHCDCNVHQYVKSVGGGVDPGLAAAWGASLLSALAAVHAAGLVHRDVKPENMLVVKPGDGSPAMPSLKLADFGLARRPRRARGAPPAGDARDDAPLTQYVSTRWYRAPEILLRDPGYGPPADVWAAGAVVAELLTGRPLFPGSDEADQVRRVTSLLGAPPAGLVARAPAGAAASIVAAPAGHCARAALAAALGPLPAGADGAVDALWGLLALDPVARPSAGAALAHPFFAKAAPPQAAAGAPWSKTGPAPVKPGREGLIPAGRSVVVAAVAGPARRAPAAPDVEAPAPRARAPLKPAVMAAQATAASAVPPARAHRCPRADADLAAAAAVLESAVAAAAAAGVDVRDALAARRGSDAV